MLDALKALFKEKMSLEEGEESPLPEGEAPPPLQVAACALLLEVAYADQEFSDSERRHLEDSVMRHFGLDEETAAQLIEHADGERRMSGDLYGFTSLIMENYNMAQKMVLLEVMWGLVYADGEVAKHETYIMRKVSQLLDVKPAFLTEAKKKVSNRHID